MCRSGRGGESPELETATQRQTARRPSAPQRREAPLDGGIAEHVRCLAPDVRCLVGVEERLAAVALLRRLLSPREVIVHDPAELAARALVLGVELQRLEVGEDGAALRRRQVAVLEEGDVALVEELPQGLLAVTRSAGDGRRPRLLRRRPRLWLRHRARRRHRLLHDGPLGGFLGWREAAAVAEETAPEDDHPDEHEPGHSHGRRYDGRSPPRPSLHLRVGALPVDEPLAREQEHVAIGQDGFRPHRLTVQERALAGGDRDEHVPSLAFHDLRMGPRHLGVGEHDVAARGAADLRVRTGERHLADATAPFRDEEPRTGRGPRPHGRLGLVRPSEDRDVLARRRRAWRRTWARAAWSAATTAARRGRVLCGRLTGRWRANRAGLDRGLPCRSRRFRDRYGTLVVLGALRPRVTQRKRPIVPTGTASGPLG